jgi:hypothetical protein
LEPGQFVCGRKQIAKELNMTERQVRYYFSTLELRQNLVIKTSNKFSVVTVVNWQSYQFNENELSNKGPTKGQQRATYNNIRTEEQIQKTLFTYEPVNVDFFETWWKVYPKKADKKAAQKAWNKIKPDSTKADQLIQAVKNQIAWRELASGEFRPAWKNGATWLNGECWNNPTDSGTPVNVSHSVRCANPDKYPPCGTVWNLNERSACPRCGWKYEEKK